MRAVRVLLLVFLCGAAGPAGAQLPVPAPAGAGATFKSGVDMVTVSAVVRDRKGRVVTNLAQRDFELFDGGRKRPIADFRPDEAAVSVALLFDASGSMQVASKIDDARAAAKQVLTWLQPGRDEVGIFSFDTGLRELQAFSTRDKTDDVQRSISGIAPFGMTSLHDAIAGTARLVARRNNVHRAVIVLTDGVDNNSQLSPPEVSGIASSIDVPVYIVAVVSPLDHPGVATAVSSDRPLPVGDLADLARWTGGELFLSSTPAHASVAAREIVNELRHQYLIAFEPTGAAGWHPLELRTRKSNLVVRARSGYMAGPSPKDSGSQQ
jgi:Ca-activated chloride channel homolog